ncbi:MAG: hypothetical protein WA997_01815 [Anaerolineales bacterium]
MQDLSIFSQVFLYLLLVLIGLYILLIGVWQIKILRGETMQNPDGTADDWHEQKTHFGIAVADVLLACPTGIIGIILVFVSPRWGFYLLALVSFWFVWANLMNTATSLRFENPKLTLNWWITFPAGGFVGLAFILWTILHFDTIYCL